ncbi:MAG: ribbon-helix-helix domain-containing protein [Alphaproteobacteria bacterium]|nr:ribbon-helix-helix domain-containing protein [Alphaproteobacteria bacterium]
MTIQIRRVISVFDKKTTMRLTQTEWIILNHICRQEKINRKKLLEMIEEKRDTALGLTPAVRLFSLLYLYNQTDGNTHPITGIENIMDAM